MFDTQSYMDVVSESGRKRGRDGEGEMDSISMGLEEHRSVSLSGEMSFIAMQAVLTTGVETTPMPSSPNFAKGVSAMAARIVYYPPQLRL
jgi:hypothetical protein